MTIPKLPKKIVFKNSNQLESFEFYDKLARQLTATISPFKQRKHLLKNEDVISEVFYQLVMADDTYDPAKNVPLKNWRQVKARYAIKNYIKQNNKNFTAQVPSECVDTYSGSLSALIEGSDTYLTCDDIDNKEIFDVCNFSDEEKNILRLKLIENKSYREIGKELNISHEWAHKITKRALRKYYEQLSK